MQSTIKNAVHLQMLISQALLTAFRRFLMDESISSFHFDGDSPDTGVEIYHNCTFPGEHKEKIEKWLVQNGVEIVDKLSDKKKGG